MDERIAALARTQHGVFTRQQAVVCDATAAIIKWRLRMGR